MLTKSHSKTCFIVALFTAGIVLGVVFCAESRLPIRRHFPIDAALIDTTLLGKSEAEVRALMGEPWKCNMTMSCTAPHISTAPKQIIRRGPPKFSSKTAGSGWSICSCRWRKNLWTELHGHPAEYLQDVHNVVHGVRRRTQSLR